MSDGFETRSLTTEVAEYAVGVTFADLPTQALESAKRHILDGLGVMLAGSTEPCARLLCRFAEGSGGLGEASVLGTNLRLPASEAALVNGTSGHAMDYDDTQLSTTPDRVYGLLTHPTTPVLAAALAVGEQRGVSGRDLLLAYSTGVEVECKIAEAINPEHYKRGFHSTGTIGIFGAATAAGKLLGLSATETRHALGIAGSMSAGLRCNFGTMTKPLHAGRAAQNGIAAAKLAALGYRADPDALDGPWGFFQITAGGCDPTRLRGKLGKPYSIVEPGVSIKPYPCGSLAHPAMDALLDLVVANDLRPEEILEIRLGTSSNVLAALRYQRPETALEAKFSLPFCLGILALERKAGIHQFTDEVVHKQQVREMMARVNTYLHDGIEAKGYDRIRGLVEVELTDGRTLVAEAEISRGTPQRPMSWEELQEKFRECAGLVLPASAIDRAIGAVKSLEQVGDVRSVVELLTTAADGLR